MLWQHQSTVGALATYAACGHKARIATQYAKRPVLTDAEIADALASMRRDFPGFTRKQIEAGLQWSVV